MADTSNRKASKRDLAFYRQRLKNRVFASIAQFFADEAKAGRATKKDIADVLGRDPAQITRWLNAPSNMTLETISDLLFAMDAEPGHMTIERFADKPKPNFVHRLIGQEMPIWPTQSAGKAIRLSTNRLAPTETRIVFPRPGMPRREVRTF